MRKRILCISALSLLLVGAFAGAAAATAYWSLQNIATSLEELGPTSYQKVYTIPTVTITLTAAYNASSAPDSTYGTGKAATVSLTYSDAGMTDNTNTLTLSKKTTDNFGKFVTNTQTVTITGKVIKSGTVTVKAVMNSITQTVDIPITIPELDKPTIDGSLSSWETDTANDQTITVYNANAGDGISVTPESGIDDLKDKYGLEIETSQGGGPGETSGTVKFKGTPRGATTGINVKIKAENEKGTTEKTYTIKIRGIAPSESKFTIYPGKRAAVTDPSDLGKAYNEDDSKPIFQGGEEVDKSKLTFGFSEVTTPLILSMTGLPSGLRFVQDTGGAGSPPAAKGTATGHIEGTPTKVGKFTGIKLTATNQASSEDQSGNLIASTFTKTYSMGILTLPEITTTKLKDITWGKPYSDKITIQGGATGYPIVSVDIFDDATYADKTGLPASKRGDGNTYFKPAGLKLTQLYDAKKGIVNGTLAGTFNAADSEDFAFGEEAEKTVKLRIVAGNALTQQFSDKYEYGLISKDVEVKFKSSKPTIVNSATIQNELTKRKLQYNGNQLESPAPFNIVANGPGTMEWSVTNLPTGLQISQDQEEGTTNRTLCIYGSPDVTVKNHVAKLTIKNGAGITTYSLKFDIGADSFDIVDKNHPIGPASVDTVVDAVFIAEPGPIVWTAKNLPSGLKLSVDKGMSFDTKVHLVGKIKSATKIDKKGQSVYEITATNKIIGKSVTTSNDFIVYGKPKITTTSLPKLTIDKAYTSKIIGTGLTQSKDYSWEIAFKAGEDGTEHVPQFIPDGGSSKLYVKYDAKTNMPTIVGSIDRFPKSGDQIVPIIVTVTLKNPVNESVSENFSIVASGTAPKFLTSKIDDFTSGKNEERKVEVTGTKPFYMRAYITDKAAKTHLNLSLPKDSVLDLASSGTDADAIAKAGGFWFESSDKGEGILHYAPASGVNYAFNGLPIVFAVSNDVSQSSNTKEITKIINVNVKGQGIIMVDKATNEEASKDIMIFVPAQTAMTPYVLKVSGDKPFTVTHSMKKTTNGISVDISAEDETVTISGTPVSDKVKAGKEAFTESNTQITVTVTSLSTKKKSTYKVTVVGMAKPEITTNEKSRQKEVELSKNVTIKLAAKGSKKAVSKGKNPVPVSKWNTKDVAYQNLSWEISDSDLEKLKAIGLDFDNATGTIKGTTSATTSNDQGDYEPITVQISAVNGAGIATESGDVTIGVKGKKFKINTKSLAFYKDDPKFGTEDSMLKTNFTADDNDANIKWSWEDTSYLDYGFAEEITSYGSNGYMGQLNGDLANVDAKKNISLKIVATNVGQVVKGTVKISIYDAKPVINELTDPIVIQAEEAIQAMEIVTFTLPEDLVTGDTKIKWALVGKPGDSKLSATLKQSGNEAIVTLKAAKKVTQQVDTTFKVSAQNTVTKDTDIKTVDVTILPIEVSSSDQTALPEENNALPEYMLTEDGELKQGEGTVTYGYARAETELTQAERTALSEGGYVIAAILPEITADESGLYDLEAVSLDEAAPEGGELVWFAFPRNAEGSEDDTIAEFYDEAGAEIFAVPEGRKVVPAPWLEKDVTYAPVIAVKAPVSGEAKDSLDEAETGDTVTEKAIEEAVNTPEVEE